MGIRLFVLGLFFWTSVAQARPVIYEVEERSSYGTLYSYEELMRLPPPQREIYIQGARDAFFDFEAALRRREQDFAGIGAASSGFFFVLGQVIEPAWAELALNCKPGWKPVRVSQNPLVEKCVLDGGIPGGGIGSSTPAVPGTRPAPPSVPKPGPQSEPPKPTAGSKPTPTPVSQKPPSSGAGGGSFKCTASAASVRPKFYADLKNKKDEEKTCVMGGNFSKYAGGVIRAGNCEKITELQVGDKKIQCELGKGLCNPLLYCGAGSDGKQKPLCLSVNQDFTQACQTSSIQKKCEILKGMGVPENEVKKMWNEFKKKQEELCKPQGSFAQFFCKECSLLSDRIKKLSSNSSGAADGPPIRDTVGGQR